MRLLISVAFGVALAASALPAQAGSQSSNSSSNCSNGQCTRVDTYVVQDRRGSHGWTRFESWDERPARHWRKPRVAPWRDDD